MPPTRMLITSTWFQSVTSYLVNINFSLCRISPQSFQFVGQIVQLLCSLQTIFQMTPLALQAHLQVAYKIVNNTNTFLYGDLPDPGCNSSSHQLFGSCFCTLGPSESPKGKHLGGLNWVSVAPTQCHTSY